MLTRLTINNFKKLESVDIELGNFVVFIGPNNSGKTSALQAMALWNVGVNVWNAKRGEMKSLGKRAGVAINRRDLTALPVPTAKLLWHDLHVRKGEPRNGFGNKGTKNILIEVRVEGVSDQGSWQCGLEFDYANEESFYCRPMRIETHLSDRMSVPAEASLVRVAFLPPMSGLTANEPKWEPGRINVLIGEGQTAQVLRNLCYLVCEKSPKDWNALVGHVKSMFGIILHDPLFINERGEIKMEYSESTGIQLDLSSSGRGLQQTLLLLTHMYANPESVLLLDEPDAHLEILRQRQVYNLINDIAQQQRCQIIAASHSEIVLNEAADRDVVVAFIGKPHRIDDRGNQLLKGLRSIGFDHYYQAEQKGWVLYLEGSTDLAILRGFARRLSHPVFEWLDEVFVHYIENQYSKATDHFFGLREARKDLVGVAILDREKGREFPKNSPLIATQWRKREIENYLCQRETLLAFAASGLDPQDMFENIEKSNRMKCMEESIEQILTALKTLGKPDPFGSEIKTSDDFFLPLFNDYYGRLNISNMMNKSDYHVLVRHVPLGHIDPEIKEKLDLILKVANSVSNETIR